MINPFVGMPAGGAVGVVFDANGNAEGALGPYEEEVRAAGDKAVPWQPTVGSVAWWISKHQKWVRFRLIHHEIYKHGKSNSNGVCMMSYFFS